MKWLKNLFLKRKNKTVEVFVLMDVLFVCVRTKHYLDCKSVTDLYQSPLALAVRDMFPDKFVTVANDTVTIHGNKYKFDKSTFTDSFVENRIDRHWNGDWTLPSYDVVKLVRTDAKS